jgi:hypothetical protein
MAEMDEILLSCQTIRQSHETLLPSVVPEDGRLRPETQENGATRRSKPPERGYRHHTGAMFKKSRKSQMIMEKVCSVVRFWPPAD